MLFKQNITNIVVKRANSFDQKIFATLHQEIFKDKSSVPIYKHLSCIGGFSAIAYVQHNHAKVEAAGFIMCRHILGETEILIIGCKPKFQKNGIGTKLIRHAIQRHKMCKRVFLEVRKDNKAAISLYEKLNFEVTRVRKGYYASGDKRIDAVEMKLEVT